MSTGSRSRARARRRPPVAAATMASKSSHVPSSGLIASWPPSAEPIAHGEPTSPGSAADGVVAALAVRVPDRVHGRQVDDVEAERARGPGAPRRHRGSRPTSAGTARTRRRTARAHDRRRPRSAAEHDLAVAVARLRGEPLGERRHGPAEQQLRPPTARRRDPPAPPPTFRRQLVLPGGDRDRSRPRRGTASGPAGRR